MKNYTDVNAKVIDQWCASGWEWGQPIDHETYQNAKKGNWGVYLTPTKYVPRNWFPNLKGLKVLGLASGGGQQMPIFQALGAKGIVFDYSEAQLESERLVAAREGYSIDIVRGDMAKPLPFQDNQFDLIFHPVSNCYVEDVEAVFNECFRVLKPGGTLLAGQDNGINYIVNDDETRIVQRLPFNPLKDELLYKRCMDNDWGIQFSHTMEEQIGSLLKAGFVLKDLYEDTNGSGHLHELNIPSFIATRSMKPE